MSKRTSPQDRHEEISNRVRWAKAMCDVIIADPDLQDIHTEAIAGVSGHLADAMRELEELYQHLPRGTDQRSKVVPINGAPADAEPAHEQ